jgi:hypothetical protein
MNGTLQRLVCADDVRLLGDNIKTGKKYMEAPVQLFTICGL